MGKINRKIESERIKADMLEFFEKISSGEISSKWDDGRTASFDILGIMMNGGRGAVANGEKKTYTPNRNYYTGFNAFITGVYIATKGFDSDIFMTGPAINKAGGMIKKGERAVDIVYTFSNYWDIRHLDGEKDKKITETEYKRLKAINPKWVKSTYGGQYPWHVFNLSQTTLEYETIDISKQNSLEKIAEAEDIIKMYNDCPRIIETHGTPCYSPSEDVVRCPRISEFKNGNFYYGTLFHELYHSTGHKSRLNRNLFGMFGSEDYGREEMTVEIASCVTQALCGLADEEQVVNNTRYVMSWEKAIRDDKDFVDHFYHAFNDAMKAIDYLMGFTADNSVRKMNRAV